MYTSVYSFLPCLKVSETCKEQKDSATKRERGKKRKERSFKEKAKGKILESLWTKFNSDVEVDFVKCGIQLWFSAVFVPFSHAVFHSPILSYIFYHSFFLFNDAYSLSLEEYWGSSNKCNLLNEDFSTFDSFKGISKNCHCFSFNVKVYYIWHVDWSFFLMMKYLLYGHH